MDLVYAVLAACCFAAGGFYMKASAGVTRLAPTLFFVVLFAVGALLQARAMRTAEMGPVYIAVLGLEAVLAVALGSLLLHERLSWIRCIAVILVLAGVILLRKN